MKQDIGILVALRHDGNCEIHHDCVKGGRGFGRAPSAVRNPPHQKEAAPYPEGRGAFDRSRSQGLSEIRKVRSAPHLGDL